MSSANTPGQGSPADGTPQSAEDWVDLATSQGVPPDYAPPGTAPAGSVPVPEPAGPGTSETPSLPADGPQPPHAPAGPTVVDTSVDKRDGLDKCPRCGSTEISLRPSSGKLICHFCRHEWSEVRIEAEHGFDSPVRDLRGLLIGSGASDIPESTENVLTLKCQACGAEVIVNTEEAVQSRCHWCRNTLSINQQLPNGAVPDGILPFSVTREDAIARISEFVGKRKFFAHPKFVSEFAPTEVVGVYLPYLVVDASANVNLSGTGEVMTRRYTRKRGEKEVTYYDADVYQVGRSFDLFVDDVVLESSGERADINTTVNTNNVINAIQPFDLKESVAYNANYLRGFTSEKRDLQVRALLPEAYDRVQSIGRARASEMISAYDRGVRWEREHLEIRGSRWVAVYVPVWLYSYHQQTGSGGMVHYVAVNGRTGQTMGSVPVRQGRLISIAVAIGVVGTIVGGLLDIFLR